MNTNNLENIIKLEIKDDGIHIIIDKNKGSFTRSDLLKIIEDCEIAEIDFTAINNIFKSDDMIIEEKISSSKNITKKDESVTIEIDKEKLTATAKLVPAGFLGGKLNREIVDKQISNADIKFGIDQVEIEKLINEREYNKPYIVARGIECIDSIDGYLEYKFDRKKKVGKPKILDDGSVDNHRLDFFEPIGAGEELIIVHLPVEGTDGTNVLGQVISHRPGKFASNLPKGKNTKVIGDEEALVATVSGMIIYDNNKLDVSPLLEIKGDVGTSTGDIVFGGSVLVRGSVLTGYSIEADDMIEVIGVVEGAKLKSNSDISLYNGVQGMERAYIEAKGNITVKFAESCFLKSGMNINAGSIMHSDIDCGKNLVIDGRLSVFLGGKARVANKIIARRIGSAMATKTDLVVGNNPEKIEYYEEKMSELKRMEKDYSNIDQVYNNLKNDPLTNNSDQKKNLLIRATETRKSFAKRIAELRDELQGKLIPELRKGQGGLYVSDVIRSGVKVTIGNAQMNIKDDIFNCVLSNVEGKIQISPYVQTDTD